MINSLTSWARETSPGFLVNRTLTPYMMEAFIAMDEGIKPEVIDAAAEEFEQGLARAECQFIAHVDHRFVAGQAADAIDKGAQHADGLVGAVEALLGVGAQLWHQGRGFVDGLFFPVALGTLGLFDGDEATAEVSCILLLSEGIHDRLGQRYKMYGMMLW